MQTFAIIPAAGSSSRMGRPKLLLPWRGGVVLQAVLEAWSQGGVDHIIVVARAEDAALLEVCHRAGVEVCAVSPAPPEMKDSIRLGLRFAKRFKPDSSDAWLLAPADMPTLSAHVIRQLIAAYGKSQGGGVLAPAVQGKRGHPVLFSWALAAEVELLAPDEGVNVLGKRHGYRVIEVADAGILDDLDTPDDYRRLCE